MQNTVQLNCRTVFGKWKEIGKTATLEFWKDGTFKAVDNQKMAVKGKYTLNKLPRRKQRGIRITIIGDLHTTSCISFLAF